MSMILRFTPFIVLTLLFGASMHAYGQDCALEIRISNIRTAEGKMMVAVFDRPASFLSDEVAHSTIVPVSDASKLVCSIAGVKQGEYAISVFHDMNDNGKLDKNFVGIPTEPIGFSNNARGSFGPPKFEDAKFSVDQAHQFVEITLY